MLRRLAKDLLLGPRGAARALLDQPYVQHEGRGLFTQLGETSYQPAFRLFQQNLTHKPVWEPRWTSTTTNTAGTSEAQGRSGSKADASHGSGTDGSKQPAPDAEQGPSERTQTGAEEAADVQARFEEQETQLAACQQQVDELKDVVVRTLADMENLRQRTARQAESAQKFAIQGFVKGLLDVADNLDRAYTNIQEEVAAVDAGEKEMSQERAFALLKNLLDGVRMTDNILLKVFKANGVEKYSPVGEKFDPNLHSALFEIPDPSKEPGTIAIVSKSGFSLSGRVVRPAEVGVVRAP